MIKPILKQRSGTRIQGLYLANNRDVPNQVFGCYVAASAQPSTNKTYWIQFGEDDPVKVNIDFVNLDKQLPPFMAQARLNDELQESQYRGLTLLEGDAIATATPVEQDSSTTIWEMIFSL